MSESCVWVSVLFVCMFDSRLSKIQGISVCFSKYFHLWSFCNCFGPWFNLIYQSSSLFLCIVVAAESWTTEFHCCFIFVALSRIFYWKEHQAHSLRPPPPYMSPFTTATPLLCHHHCRCCCFRLPPSNATITIIFSAKKPIYLSCILSAKTYVKLDFQFFIWPLPHVEHNHVCFH